MTGWTAMDMGLTLLMGLAALRGFSRGFVQEVLRLGALVAAVAAVYFLHVPAAALARDVVANDAGATLLAFTVLFGVTLALGRFVAARIGGASRRSLVGPFDRVLGAGFGLARGLLVASVLFMAATFVVDVTLGRDAPRPDWMRDSRSYPALSATSAALSDFIEAKRDAPRPTS